MHLCRFHPHSTKPCTSIELLHFYYAYGKKKHSESHRYSNSSIICLCYSGFRIRLFQRNFYHTSTGTKEKLYSMLAKPHLNYATAAWDPHTTKNINELERVQNAAARFIKGTYGKDGPMVEASTSRGWKVDNVLDCVLS